MPCMITFTYTNSNMIVCFAGIEEETENKTYWMYGKICSGVINEADAQMDKQR